MEWSAIGCVVFFVGLGISSGRMLQHWEDNFFKSQIIFSKQTPYQKLVLTKNKSDLRLYINRIIQFSSMDEYRYHESLALIPLQAAPYKKSVLILGGGEGLLAREVLKHPKVESITIVDLDEEVFKIAKENPFVKEVNEGALLNPKVKLVTRDAMTFLTETPELFDVILADLPDPSNESLARLYSTSFFKLAKNRMTPNGVFVTQASSAFHTRNAYWCIYESIAASGFNNVYPYHTYVPSFGDWGFVMATDLSLEPQKFKLEVDCKYLDTNIVKKMFYFEKDISNPGNIEPNRLDQPVLLNYFLKDWEKWRREKKN